MEIEHLKYFQKALIDWDRVYADNKLLSRPLNLSQIEVIEKTLYASSTKKLPAVLREMLFLTGGFCNFFDAGVYLNTSNESTLEAKHLLAGQHQNPYFKQLKKTNAEDTFFNGRLIWSFFTAYESSDGFHFVYLDEDEEDPIVFFFDTDDFREGSEKNLIHAQAGLFEVTNNIRLSELITETYQSACQLEHQRPPYNEHTPSSHLSASSSGEDNSLKNQDTFYSLISNRDLSGAAYFIEQGIDVSADNNRAILETARTDDPAGFDLLFAAGADPYDQNEKILELAGGYLFNHLLEKLQFSQTALDRALVRSCTKFDGFDAPSIRHLIEKGADINAFNALGLQLAVRYRHFSSAGILVSEYKANNKVNFGFVLLYKTEMGPHAQQILPSDMEVSHPIGAIIQKHEDDLKDFFGAGYTKEDFPEYPLEVKPALDKKGRANTPKREGVTFWQKLKSKWS